MGQHIETIWTSAPVTLVGQAKDVSLEEKKGFGLEAIPQDGLLGAIVELIPATINENRAISMHLEQRGENVNKSEARYVFYERELVPKGGSYYWGYKKDADGSPVPLLTVGFTAFDGERRADKKDRARMNELFSSWEFGTIGELQVRLDLKFKQAGADLTRRYKVEHFPLRELR